MATDYPDWGALAALQTFITNLNLASQTLQATATEIADEIAATGVPLLGNPVELYNTTSYTLAAGASATVIYNAYGQTLAPMSDYLSYDISVSALCDASSADPFVTLRLDWFANDTTDYLLWREYWTLPAASNTAIFSWGSGPVRGAYLQVLLTNEDATYTQNIGQLVLYGNSRPAPEATPDWRSNVISGLTVPGYTVPNTGLAPMGAPGYFSGSLAKSASLSLIAGIYYGEVNLQVTVTGTSPDLAVTPSTFMTGHGVQQISGTFNVGTEADSQSAQYWSPSGPLIIALTNENASDSVSYVITLVSVPR